MPRRRPLSVLPLVIVGLVPLLGSSLQAVRAQPPRVSARPPEFGVIVEKNVLVAMHDGVHLAIDIYRPARDGKPAPGRFPTLLTRTPYRSEERRVGKECLE